MGTKRVECGGTYARSSHASGMCVNGVRSVRRSMFVSSVLAFVYQRKKQKTYQRKRTKMPLADILTHDAMAIVMEHLSITDALVVRETSQDNRRNPDVVRRLEAEMERAKRESFARNREFGSIIKAMKETADIDEETPDIDHRRILTKFDILHEEAEICKTEMIAAMHVQWHYDEVHYNITGDDEYAYPPYDVEDA